MFVIDDYKDFIVRNDKSEYGVQVIYEFPNGYKISISNNIFSVGNEVVVMFNDDIVKDLSLTIKSKRDLELYLTAFFEV